MGVGNGLRLTRIRVYPLKGAAGHDLECAEPDAFGIPWDRRWMLVEPGGGFLSQRTHPRLALIRVAAEGREGTFRVEAPAMDAHELSAGGALGDWMEVRVHDDTLRVPRVASGAGAWFSEFLGTPCELVFIPLEVHRPVDPTRAPGRRVGFADAYPLLLATEDSLEDLNRRGPERSSMIRFRPNLVVRGGVPWEEDRWRALEVGGARVELVKPCARCSVTTVDPASGTRGEEPLRTLAEFRRWEGKAHFGQNGVFAGGGGFRVGDRVRSVEEGDPRPSLPR